MKLVTKTSLFYLLPGIPILLLSGFLCYEVATEEIEENNDVLLYNIEKKIEHYIRTNDTLTIRALTASRQAEITSVNSSENTAMQFSDTIVYDRWEDEYNENRMLTSYVHAKSGNFRIRIWRATMNSSQLLEGIVLASLTIIGMLSIVYFLLNYYASKVLWKPFYKVLDNLNSFHASDGAVPLFIESKIGEFSDLNTSLEAMMQTMIVDYNRQKKYTESVSHEIQTPLAVIKSKIDLLIQSPEMSPTIAPLIATIDDSCSKLIRINRSLLLLTRIENKQFKTDESISFVKKVSSALQLFEDHLLNQQITVTTDFKQDFNINGNSDLCMVMINNLLQNAIRHNYKGGTIHFVIEAHQLIISNSGQKKMLDQEKIFQRFNKNNEIQDSIGLGLSIAKEIAECNNLHLNYFYKEELHVFCITNLK